MGPPSSALSLVISVTASPVNRRVFQSTVLVVEEKTTFGMSRQRWANSISAGVAPGCWSAVGQWELIVSQILRPYNAVPVAPVQGGWTVIDCPSRTFALRGAAKLTRCRYRPRSRS